MPSGKVLHSHCPADSKKDKLSFHTGRVLMRESFPIEISTYVKQACCSISPLQEDRENGIQKTAWRKRETQLVSGLPNVASGTYEDRKCSLSQPHGSQQSASVQYPLPCHPSCPGVGLLCAHAACGCEKGSVEGMHWRLCPLAEGATSRQGDVWYQARSAVMEILSPHLK